MVYIRPMPGPLFSPSPIIIRWESVPISEVRSLPRLKTASQSLRRRQRTDSETGELCRNLPGGGYRAGMSAGVGLVFPRGDDPSSVASVASVAAKPCNRLDPGRRSPRPYGVPMPPSMRNQGKRAEALDVLSSIYSRFTEGFETRDLSESEALLTELQCQLRPAS
jgi:hypothetical protein